MSRVYTIKSNARRDCRKLGLDPDLVKQVQGGWAIDYPDATVPKLIKKPKAAKPAKAKKPGKAQKAAKKPRAKREGEGVTFLKGQNKWQVQLCIPGNRQPKYIGSYLSKDDAVAAYASARGQML